MRKLNLTALVLFSAMLAAQTDEKILEKMEEKRVQTLTSLKTNNLSELFQAALDNGIVAGNRSNASVKTTLFGIQKLIDPSITAEERYKRAAFARNFEFGTSLGINTSNKLNQADPSIKWAIINNRDLSVIDRPELNDLNNALRNVDSLQNSLLNEIAKRANALPGQDRTDALVVLQKVTKLSNVKPEDIKSEADKIAFFENELKNNPALFSKLDPNNDLFAPMKKNAKEIDDLQNKLTNKIRSGALLTLNINGRYRDVYWDSAGVKLEFLQGLGAIKDKEKPFDLQASLSFSTKKTATSVDLAGRQIISGKAGVNKVLLKNNEGASFMEVLGGVEYTRITSGVVTGEEEANFFLDFTFTFRLNKTSFLPIEIKYDPQNANVFGYFKLKWDITSKN
jgi:hypothetical protein